LSSSSAPRTIRIFRVGGFESLAADVALTAGHHLAKTGILSKLNSLAERRSRMLRAALTSRFQKFALQPYCWHSARRSCSLVRRVCRPRLWCASAPLSSGSGTGSKAYLSGIRPLAARSPASSAPRRIPSHNSQSVKDCSRHCCLPRSRRPLESGKRCANLTRRLAVIQRIIAQDIESGILVPTSATHLPQHSYGSGATHSGIAT